MHPKSAHEDVRKGPDGEGEAHAAPAHEAEFEDADILEAGVREGGVCVLEYAPYVAHAKGHEAGEEDGEYGEPAFDAALWGVAAVLTDGLRGVRAHERVPSEHGGVFLVVMLEGDGGWESGDFITGLDVRVGGVFEGCVG